MSAPAVRVDIATGIEERLEHVTTPRGKLYTWIARPPQARTCVVVCSSIFGDFTANYSRERLLGRELAKRGLGVIRFHYAGDGNSEGERRDMTFSSLCDDAETILKHALSLGFSNLGLLGTRVGALVAAASAASSPSTPLALWEPVADPLRLIVDARRAQRISGTAQGRTVDSRDWREELDRNGVLDLLGYDIYPPLVHSLLDVDLLSTLGIHCRPIFVARFRGRSEDSDPIADALRTRGFLVESGFFDVSESWWFQDELASDSGDLVPTTVGWLTGVLAEKE